MDIIPGVTRSNTYEDIYGYLKPLDESEPDPMMDPRPLRRTSLTNGTLGGQLPNADQPLQRPSFSSEFEDSDDEAPPAKSSLLNGTANGGPRGINTPMPAYSEARRPSGVLPNGYPSSGQLGQLISAMRALEKSNKQSNDIVPNGDVGNYNRPRRRSLSERRPSGLFPRMGPEMKRFRLTTLNADTTDSRTLARRLTCVEEEDEEDSEESEEYSDSELSGLSPGEVLEEVKEDEEETDNAGSGKKHKQPIILHARLNEGCFINRNIKMKDAQDAYGISTKTERRTYFSSERHMECFEEEFDDLVKVLNKEHLNNTSQRQGVAVTANELMIEEVRDCDCGF